MITTGGGAGVGGWAFKDHPQLQSLFGLFRDTSQSTGEDHALKSTLASAVSGVLQKDDPRKSGVYRVRITEVKLDPDLFSEGHTVDIQARISRVDERGRETTIWESKPFGENLGVAG